MKKYKEEYSDNTNNIIGSIYDILDEQLIIMIAEDVDATIDDICDAVDYLLKSKWMSKTLFARKVMYRSDDNNKEEFGVLFSHREEDFEKYEKTKDYYIVKDTPMVIGLDHNNPSQHNYEEKFPDDTILIKSADGTVQTRKTYQEQTNGKKVLIKTENETEV